MDAAQSSDGNWRNGARISRAGLGQKMIFANAMSIVRPLSTTSPSPRAIARSWVPRSFHDERDLESLLVNAETLEKELERPVNQNASVYSGLSTIYYRLFQLTRLEGYLTLAISNGWTGYNKLTKEDPDRAAIAGNLSSTLLSSHDCGGNSSIAHLDESLALAEEAIALTDKKDVYRNIYIHNVMKGLVSRSSQPGRSQDLSEAISRGDDLLRKGRSYPKWPDFAVTLCGALKTRYERRGSAMNSPAASDDLAKAIEIAQDVLKQAQDYPGLYRLAESLQDSLREKWNANKSVPGLKALILKSREFVHLAPKNSKHRLVALEMLAKDLERYVEMSGDSSTVDEILEYRKELVQAGEETTKTRMSFLQEFQEKLKSCYRDTSDGKISGEKFIAGEIDRSIRLSASQNQLHANELSRAIQSKFTRTGQEADLEESIRVCTEALNETSSGDLKSQTLLQCTLSLALENKYMREPTEETLLRVTDSCKTTIDNVPPDFNDICGLFTTIASIYARVYDQCSEEKYLNEAITVAQKALDESPEGISQTRATCASNLAGLWYRFFTRTGIPAFLDLELKVMEIAQNSVPPGNAALHATVLFNIGAALMLKYEASTELDDFKRAAEKVVEAADRMPIGHEDRPLQIANLGSVLGQRFRLVSHNIRDLELAILKGEESLKMTPLSSPFYASRAVRLGLNLELLCKEEKTPENMKRCIDTFMDAWNSRTSLGYDRLNGVVGAARILVMTRTEQNIERASQILCKAVESIPILNPDNLIETDQHYNLRRLAGLSADAAALVLESGRPASEALSVLELGRGIIASRYIDFKSDLSELESENQVLYQELQRHREALSSATSEGVAEDSGIRQEESLRALESTIRKIKTIPRFKTFLSQPNVKDLVQEAAKGPIVVLNVSEYRSDAILVTKAGITFLRLEKLSSTDADTKRREMMDLVLKNTPRTWARNNNKMKEILNWLWDVVAKPIMDELERLGLLATDKDQRLPRVYWICAGMMSWAPIHAAGALLSNPKESIAAKVISSYATTIKALRFARRGVHKKATPESRNMLIVPMEDTPGQRRLRGVTREVAAIVNGDWWTSSKTLTDPDPNPDEVIRNLLVHNFVHFACHGQSHSIDPSLSRLMLLKKDASPREVDSLSVKTLSNTLADDGSKAVAFLSACNSAESETSGLHDESIHIAAGFQLAGFRHVIGTLWYAVDDACVEITKEFYRSLFSDANTTDVIQSFDENVAAALHEAIGALREEEPDQPLMWAPFVHFGA